jgi:hypothetical protein
MSSMGPTGGFSFLDARVDYAPIAFRVGCECPHVLFPGTICQGTYEALLEYNVSPIVRSFGGFFTGPCGILRYNYRPDGSPLIPYVQAGAGFVFTDAYREQRQELIGQAFEFLLRAEVGVRFLISERLSLDIEGGYQHISNASLAERNGGINNFGASAGFTWTFGRK